MLLVTSGWCKYSFFYLKPLLCKLFWGTLPQGIIGFLQHLTICSSRCFIILALSFGTWFIGFGNGPQYHRNFCLEGNLENHLLHLLVLRQGQGLLIPKACKLLWELICSAHVANLRVAKVSRVPPYISWDPVLYKRFSFRCSFCFACFVAGL